MPIKNTQASAAIYSPLILKMYDLWVLGISNRFAWQCATNKVLVPFFKKHFSNKHLDVGVGTGFYLAKMAMSAEAEITLLDLNENSLNAAVNRIYPIIPNRLLHNIFEPLPKRQNLFDSISMFYVLHCLPGTFKEKEAAIINLKSYLSENGTLYGATILGADAGHNCFSNMLMALYNKKGIFSNKEDSFLELKQMLERNFQHVEIHQQGRVALFSAHN